MKYFKKKTEKTLVLKYPEIRSYVSLQYHGLIRKRSSIDRSYITGTTVHLNRSSSSHLINFPLISLK